jgi:hypothetical protein
MVLFEVIGVCFVVVLAIIGLCWVVNKVIDNS